MSTAFHEDSTVGGIGNRVTTVLVWRRGVLGVPTLLGRVFPCAPPPCITQAQGQDSHGSLAQTKTLSPTCVYVSGCVCFCFRGGEGKASKNASTIRVVNHGNVLQPATLLSHNPVLKLLFKLHEHEKTHASTYPELSTLKYPQTSGVERKLSSLMVPLVGCAPQMRVAWHTDPITINVRYQCINE